MANCVYCGSLLTRHQAFAGTTCDHWRCREKRLNSQLVAHRTEAARVLGVTRPERFPIAVVPHGLQELVPLAAESRLMLAGFLHGLMDAVAEEADPEPSAAVQDPGDSPAIAAHLGRVCAVCRGYCCHHGAAHNAFLDRKTLLRFQAARPDLPMDGVIAVYLDLLPDRHCRDACLYQGAQGCVLPRGMRADICNGYECGGLKAARASFDPAGGGYAYVAVRHDHRIQRSAFVEDQVIRPYPVDDPAQGPAEGSRSAHDDSPDG